jgi:hypothetical protein
MQRAVKPDAHGTDGVNQISTARTEKTILNHTELKVVYDVDLNSYREGQLTV